MYVGSAVTTDWLNNNINKPMTQRPPYKWKKVFHIHYDFVYSFFYKCTECHMSLATKFRLARYRQEEPCENYLRNVSRKGRLTIAFFVVSHLRHKLVMPMSAKKSMKNDIIYLYRNISFLLFLYPTTKCNYVERSA